MIARSVLVFAAASALVSCGQADRTPKRTGDSPIEAGVPVPDLTALPAPTEPPSAPAAPPLLTPEAEKGEKGARNLLLSWARAIELERFDEAWTLLSPADREKWSRSEWAKMFADLGEITVAAPTGTMEGAAGSLYYTAPMTITGTDRDGRPIRYAGEAILRRVNDVDGASPAQLRWHFERLTLDWAH